MADEDVWDNHQEHAIQNKDFSKNKMGELSAIQFWIQEDVRINPV